MKRTYNCSSRREYKTLKIEAYIIQCKNKFDEKYMKEKFVNNSNTLDGILNYQRPSSGKTRLGYNKKSYVVALMSLLENKDS